MSSHLHSPLALAVGLVLGLGSVPGPVAARAFSLEGLRVSPSQVLQDTVFTTWVLVADRSEALYRVREQLAGIDLPSDAVGSTSSVLGSIVVADDGTIDTQRSEFRVALATLATDSDRRDNYVRTRTLEVEQYPEAVLIPLRFSGLPFPLPQSGTVEFQLEADLTLHGATETIAWTVTADLSPSTITGVATASFPFQLFDITKPSVARVLSVEDTIRLELDFVLERRGG